MDDFRRDPYLWIHLAGLAAVPLWVDGCLLGLSTGEPLLPTGVELGLVEIAGIAPVLWMQWQKPFCIYSLLVLSLRPDSLDEQQRRLLNLFQGWLQRLLALLVLPLLLVGLWKLYALAPLAVGMNPLATQGRGLGLLVAAICFLLVNLFVQVPVSVMRVLAASKNQIEQLNPYPTEQISRDFMLVGIPVRRILPDLVAASAKSQPTQSASASAFGAAPKVAVDSAKVSEPDLEWEEDSQEASSVEETEESDALQSRAMSSEAPEAASAPSETEASEMKAPEEEVQPGAEPVDEAKIYSQDSEKDPEAEDL